MFMLLRIADNSGFGAKLLIILPIKPNKFFICPIVGSVEDDEAFTAGILPTHRIYPLFSGPLTLE